MVAEAKKKVRTTDPISGKFRWVDPDELAARDMQRQAVADLSAGELLDWDGNAVEASDDYDEYVNAMPSKDELRRYKQPVRYWEVRYPGCSLQPVPRMGVIASTASGLWQAHNVVQERAIREHITISTSVAGYPTDPDDLRISDEEMAVMSGKGGDIQYCQNPGCFFVTCSMRAGKLHALTNGHRLDYKPRSI